MCHQYKFSYPLPIFLDLPSFPMVNTTAYGQKKQCNDVQERKRRRGNRCQQQKEKTLKYFYSHTIRVHVNVEEIKSPKEKRYCKKKIKKKVKRCACSLDCFLCARHLYNFSGIKSSDEYFSTTDLPFYQPVLPLLEGIMMHCK